MLRVEAVAIAFQMLGQDARSGCFVGMYGHGLKIMESQPEAEGEEDDPADSDELRLWHKCFSGKWT
jgi:hypothetical protein